MRIHLQTLIDGSAKSHKIIWILDFGNNTAFEKGSKFTVSKNVPQK